LTYRKLLLIQCYATVTVVVMCLYVCVCVWWLQHQLDSALFWANKLVTLSEGKWWIVSMNYERRMWSEWNSKT